MKIATWLVVSHFRPHLLAATLDHLRTIDFPAGWRSEIVVAHAAGDRESAAVARAADTIVVPTNEPHPSGKRNAGLREATGELVMTTDDDDFQSPMRPALAIAAYDVGHKLSGIREFRRLHLASGNVVRYCGRGSSSCFHARYPDMTPVICGTARNYAARLLYQHGGWRADLKSLEDHDLHKRITKRRGSEAGIREWDLGGSLADTTIICQHDQNIFERPEVAKGQVDRFGDYVLIGEGHWSELETFPVDVAQRLAAVGKL